MEEGGSTNPDESGQCAGAGDKRQMRLQKPAIRKKEVL